MVEISVVVPTRNRVAFLRQSLGSALAQEGADLEVVVVDDASDDDAAQVVRSFADPRVRLVVHERAEGVARARNHGARLARGAWLAFLDDDDLWAPDKLARQLTAAHQAGATWVYGGAVEIDAQGHLLGGSPPPTPQALLRGLTGRNDMPAGSSNVAIQTSVFRQVGGFDPALRHLADWDLWLRLAQHGPPAVVEVPVVAYRQHAGQATLDTAGMLAEARVLQERHGIRVAAIHRWMAWSLLRSGDRRGAARAYLGAVRHRDVVSLARLSVALLHPDPTGARRSAEHAAWSEPARSWLPR